MISGEIHIFPCGHRSWRIERNGGSRLDSFEDFFDFFNFRSKNPTRGREEIVYDECNRACSGLYTSSLILINTHTYIYKIKKQHYY